MNIDYDKCPILETCKLKIQNGHVSGKFVPPSGGSREIARRLPPRIPRHPYFQKSNRAQIKDRIDNKTVEKKGVPIPSGRAHHR